MIEALLGSLLGSGTRLAQSWFALQEKRAEMAHEAAMLEANIKLDAQRAAAALAQANVEAASAEIRADVDALIAATNAQARPSGVRWVDALNGSFRPVVSYWHCVVLYTAYKIAAGATMFATGAVWNDVVVALWTEPDTALMSSIIGFWFVDRSLRKSGRG